MKGLYFYKLTSPYQEDVTKDYKLTVNEIDHNFLALKNTDVENIQFDNESGLLTLTQLNGEKFETSIDLSHFTRDFNVEWNKEKGILTFYYDNKVIKIDDILSQAVDNGNCTCSVMTQIITDNTIKGTGIASDPLGISQEEIAGKFRAVERLINKIDGETLPSDVKYGDRYLTREKKNIYGFLYNYKAVEEINSKLHDGWRVPTKEDWDGLLNAIEECDDCKTHNTADTDFLGCFAGKYLKSHDYWNEAKDKTNKDGLFENPEAFAGINKFKMAILPSGRYNIDSCKCVGVGDYGVYWTFTKGAYSDFWGKVFRYDSTKVEQVWIDDDNKDFCALRLVKNYDGENFKDPEVINGVSYTTTILPSENSEKGLIWTTSNYVNEDLENEDGIYRYEQTDLNTTKDTYFINEWDGYKWLRRELRDGDSLVIKNGFDGNTYDEYVVVEGELINTKHELFETIQTTKDELNQKVDVNIEAITNTITVNKEELSQDINEVSEDLDMTQLVVSAALNDLNNKIKNAQDVLELRIDSEVETINSIISETKSELVGLLDVTIDGTNSGFTTAVQSIDINSEKVHTDDKITIIGTPLAQLINPNNDLNVTIDSNTNLQELLIRLLQQELYPTNVVFIEGTVSHSTFKPNITANITKDSYVEVGTECTFNQVTAPTITISTTSRKLENIEYGYSTDNNNTKEQASTKIEKVAKDKKVNSGTHKFVITYNGFDGVSNNTQSGNTANACVVASHTAKVKEGDNKITVAYEAPQVSATFDEIPLIYFCSNLQNTNADNVERAHGQETITSSTKPNSEESYTVKGAWYSYIGGSNGAFTYNSTNVRALGKKTLRAKGSETVSVTMACDNVVIAFPSAWGVLKTVKDNGSNTIITNNFNAPQEVTVKGANEYSGCTYKVYVYTPSVKLKNGFNYTITIG